MDSPGTESKRQPAIGKVFREALLVAIVGLALAFVANALSPRGLKLSQNYFMLGVNPVATNRPVSLPLPNRATNNIAETNTSALSPVLISIPRLAEKGLQGIDSDQALRFYHDARRKTELLVFVDARDTQKYQQGHIPGAYELDPYRPEQKLATTLPACQAADVVVVYCTSSNCEDSELSAMLLRNVGIPGDKLFVYVGGITEWTAKSLPLEIGGRHSGVITNASK